MNDQKLTYYRLLMLQLNKLSVAMIYGISLLMGLVIILLWFFFMFQPFKNRQHILANQIEQINTISDISQKIGHKENSVKMQLKNAQHYHEGFLKQSNEHQILEFLESALNLDFMCKSYTPHGCEQKKWYCGRLAKIELVGPYQMLENLLQLIIRMPLWCKKIMVQRASPDSVSVQLDTVSLEEIAS